MDGLWGKIPLKWMIWGYPYFWKPPLGSNKFVVFCLVAVAGHPLFRSCDNLLNHSQPSPSDSPASLQHVPQTGWLFRVLFSTILDIVMMMIMVMMMMMINDNDDYCYCLYLSWYKCMYIYICIHMCVYIYIYIQYIRTYIYMYTYIYIYTRNAWALPRRCSVEGPHFHSNVVATEHSIGKIKGIREY